MHYDNFKSANFSSTYSFHYKSDYRFNFPDASPGATIGPGCKYSTHTLSFIQNWCNLFAEYG